MGHVTIRRSPDPLAELLDLTSLTVEEFQQLVPPFEVAFQAHMAQWRFDGQPRTAAGIAPIRLSAADARRSAIVYPGLPENLPPPGGQGRLFGMDQSKGQSMDSRSARGAAGHPAGPGGRPQPVLTGLAQRMGVTEAEAAALVVPTVEPSSPVEPPAQLLAPFLATMGRNGASRALRTRMSRRAVIVARETCHTVKNVLLINAAPTILFLSDTYAGSTHDKRIADTTPYPLPMGNRLLQELGFLAFTSTTSRSSCRRGSPGAGPSHGPRAANRRIARRRVRIEHVNSRVKRCRIVHDTCRLREGGCPRSGDGNLLCRLTFGCASPRGSRWFNRNDSAHYNISGMG